MQRCTHLTYRGHKYTESPNMIQRTNSQFFSLVKTGPKLGSRRGRKMRKTRPQPAKPWWGIGLPGGRGGVALSTGHLWFFVHTSTLLSPRAARELSKVRTTSTWNKKKGKRAGRERESREREQEKRMEKKEGERERERRIYRSQWRRLRQELDRLSLQSLYQRFHIKDFILFYSRKRRIFQPPFETLFKKEERKGRNLSRALDARKFERHDARVLLFL